MACWAGVTGHIGAEMSDTDSFIDEVTEEVRRDQLYGYLRRYGWIPALAIVLIVAGTGWNEYRKSQAQANAETMGDALNNALRANDAEGRAADLAAVTPATSGNAAVLQLLLSAAQSNSDQVDMAIDGLNRIASDGALPEIYREIAGFKALLLQSDSMPATEKRLQLEALATPGKALRLLAEEQLALMDVAEGETELALARLQAILQDAEATPALQERASQLIVALGATPETLAVSQG